MGGRHVRRIRVTRKNRRLCLALAAGVALALPAAEPGSAELYKWVDKNGKVHYSNTPVKGAKQATPKRSKYGFNQGGETGGRGIAYRGSNPSRAVDDGADGVTAEGLLDLIGEFDL